MTTLFVGYPVSDCILQTLWLISGEKRQMSAEDTTQEQLMAELKLLRQRVAQLEKDQEERRRMEESLRLAQFSLDGAADAVVWLRPDASIVYANDAACRQLEYSRAELLRMTAHDIDPGFPQEVWAEHWQELRQRKTLRFESVHRAKSGLLAPVEITCSYVEFGDQAYNCSFARDITKRKRAEQALRTSEERFRSLVETTSDWIWETDARGVYTYVSPKVKELLGYEPAELVGQTPFTLMPPAEAEQLAPAVRLLFERAQPFTGLENLNLHKDGRPVVLETNGVPLFDERGVLSGFRGIDRDITLRKQTEEALRESQQMLQTVLDTIPVRVFWKDLASNFLGCNRCFALDAGLQSPAEIIGRNDFAMGWSEQAELYRSDDQQVMETGRPKIGYEEPQTTPEGAQIWLHTSKVPLLDSQGRIKGVLGTYEDITERKRTEGELLTIHKLESVGLLAGGIAHDFNNLLTVIVGNISLAKMATTQVERAFRRLEEAEKACARAKDLTQQLLTFARGGAPVKKMTSLEGIIKDSCRLMLSGSGSRCELEIARDLWLVAVDEGQIRQVMGNIIMNAAQAMPAGGVMQVRAANVLLEPGSGLPLAAGEYVRISIQDEGIGIGKEELRKVFDPYFTTKSDGRGLGLATVYSIITRHGGYVTAESEPGFGATFHVYLPALQQAAPPDAHQPEENPPGVKGKVLIMDDEEVVREVTGEMLRHLGYEVEFAEEGLTAIQAYFRAKELGNPFDTVLMDLTIPGGMGGKEAAERLLSLDPGAKLIVFSGYFSDPVMAEYAKHGFTAVIAKPFRIEQLGKIVDQVTGAAGPCRRC
jgi:PAS domain S-box-containing protein